MKIRRIFFIFLLTPFLSCNQDEISNAGFLSFTTNGQTLPTAFNTSQKQVRFEIDHDVDITTLVPEFNVPEGYEVYLNGDRQVSGISAVDFSKPVTYELRDKSNHLSTWQANAVALSCKILIDASHDGGVWWYPQYDATGYDANQWHQGTDFANILRQKGFEVDELGRDKELTEEMFFGYYIVIRVNGFNAYSSRELEVYTNLIARGMNLAFFTDHKQYDPVDELGDHLGIKFEGAARGEISKFTPHTITANLTSIEYIAGSVLTNADQNSDIVILGWLGPNDYADLNINGVRDPNEPFAPPVMGIINHNKSHIFFIGDTNGLEVKPQPFIDNLIEWMGSCNY